MNKLLILAAAIACCALSYAEPPTAPPATLHDQVVDETARLYRIAVADMEHAADVMLRVRKAEDTPQAAAALKKAFDSFSAFYHEYNEPGADFSSSQEVDPEAWNHAAKRVVDAWAAICKSTGFSSSRDSAELVYQLFIRHTPLTIPMLHRYCIMESILSMNPIDPQQPPPDDLMSEQKRWREKVHKKHTAYLATHSDTLTGGDGSDQEHAICLVKEAANAHAEQASITPYINSVFSKVDATFIATCANPDGSLFRIYCIYKGLYTDPSGAPQLRVLPIWFRVKAPRPDTPATGS